MASSCYQLTWYRALANSQLSLMKTLVLLMNVHVSIPNHLPYLLIPLCWVFGYFNTGNNGGRGRETPGHPDENSYQGLCSKCLVSWHLSYSGENCTCSLSFKKCLPLSPSDI